jgi:hypothetical protein
MSPREEGLLLYTSCTDLHFDLPLHALLFVRTRFLLLCRRPHRFFPQLHFLRKRLLPLPDTTAHLLCQS